MKPTDWQCPHCTFTTRYRPNYVAHIALHRKIETVTGEALVFCTVCGAGWSLNCSAICPVCGKNPRQPGETDEVTLPADELLLEAEKESADTGCDQRQHKDGD